MVRYVDLPKAFSVILGNVYKTLYNIIARRRVERENPEVFAVLDKRERSDVSQDENLLTRLEREVLQTWEIKEEKLAVIEMRVEEMIFLLKDLATLCRDEWHFVDIRTPVTAESWAIFELRHTLS